MKTTLDIRALPKAALTLLLTAMIFYAIDFSVRQWNPIKSYLPWGVDNCQWKMDDLEAHYQKYGRIDLVTLGTSVGTGCDVGIWQRETKDQLICFNLCLPGFRAENIEFLFTHYIYPKYKPKYVLYIAQPRFMLGTEGTKAHQFVPAFWKSSRVKQLLAKSFGEKIQSSFEISSYIAQTNGHVRLLLTKGSRTGVLSPALGLKNIGDYGVTHGVSWNPAHHYSTYPEQKGTFSLHGALGYISRLFSWCNEQGIQAFLINQEQNPDYWNRYPLGSKDLYRHLIQTIVSSDKMFDIPTALSLTPQEFMDTVHPNAFGLERVYRFIFNNIISPKFLLSRFGVSPEHRYRFADDANHFNENFAICRPIKIKGKMPSMFQLMAEEDGASVTLGQEIMPGDYELTIYSYNDIETTAPKDETHRIRIEAITADGRTLLSKSVAMSRAINSDGMSAMTVTQVNISEPAHLVIIADSIVKDKQLVLDLMSIRRLFLPLAEATQSSSTIEKQTVPIGSPLLFNESFSTPNPVTTTTYLALSWNNYAKDQASVIALEDGNKVLKIECLNGKDRPPVAQWIDQTLLPFLTKKTVRLSFVGKTTTGTLISGGVEGRLMGTTETVKSFGKIPDGASPQDWCEYTTELKLPDKPLETLKVDLRLGWTPGVKGYALIDDVRLEVVNE
ncbi:hypothetical protein GX645_02335 [Candidatus Sumerlaeota bacterium]|nr:hypothetical protein [Candidatus Sumerlaeota bacterium]